MEVILVCNPHHGNAIITQPAHDAPGTSPEDPLKVLTSGTYRGPSGDPYLNYYIIISVFYRKNKYSKVLDGDVHGTCTGSSCGTSRGPNDGTL